MVQRSYVADLQRRRFVLFVFARQFVIRNHAVDKVLILRITENALQQIGRFDLLVGNIVAGIGEPDPILDENGEPRKVPHDKDPSVLYVQYSSI